MKSEPFQPSHAIRATVCTSLFVAALCVSMASPTETEAATTRVDYFRSVRSLEYRGPASHHRALVSNVTRSVRTVEGTTARYDVSVAGVAKGFGNDSAGFQYGPVRLSRNLATQELSVAGEDFKLQQRIINATIRQVDKSSRPAAQWNETITLNLGRPLPSRLKMSFKLTPAHIEGAAEDTVLIAVETSPFAYFVARDDAMTAATGRYRAVVIYSPREETLYQAGSAFTAELGPRRCASKAPISLPIRLLVASPGSPWWT